MPLFECSQCHCVENTACCNYWTSFIEEQPKLCSECDPEIRKWHGRFPKQHVDELLREYPNEEIRDRVS